MGPDPLDILMEEPEEPQEIEVEIEVEEMQQCEVDKEIVEEKLVPRVRAIYKYQGQGMGFEKGEVRHTCICASFAATTLYIHVLTAFV